MITPGSQAPVLALNDYLGNHFILIVDSVSSARTNLATTLAKLGANRARMALVGSLEEARLVIQKEKPKIIFSDYQLGNDSGLDLIQSQKAEYLAGGIKDTIFVLVTGNASQSAVARAAEEDVDTFVIKPYTLNTLKSSLSQAVEVRLNPTEYLKLIELGKEKLFSSHFDEAIAFFAEAMKAHAQPTLACFYYGQAEMMKSALESAHEKFDEGLSFNKIHYKCLVGLFDLLSLQKKYHEAYDVVKKIAQYFPANPQRLASVLRLAIITENFEDMEGYYRIYLKIDNRSDELIKCMCSALVVTGKYYLRKKIRSRALQVFENAAVSAGPKTNFLLYTVETLVDFRMKDDSARFMNRIQIIAPASDDFRAARFLVSTLLGSLIDSIQMGRDAIRDGVSVPSVYEKLIVQSIKAGHLDAAEELYRTALKRWPEKVKNFVAAKEWIATSDDE